GRVAEAGLHLDENRRGGMVFEVRGLRDEAFDEEALFALLGHVVGRRTGSVVPVITGVPGGRTEDQLKAFGAAAASAGAVAMAHIVGVTPEASSLAAALGGRAPIATHVIGPDKLRAATAELTTATDGPLRTVSLGTPHLSLAGFERLAGLLAGATIHPDVTLYVATGRDVLATAEARGLTAVLAKPNAQVVVDTCTYITPILRTDGLAMTDSAKWAWYAPGNLGVSVAFGTMEDCVRSAVEGRVVRDFGWLDG
ncbi:MAG: aconitase X, partial [Candidatus Limnocylindrales bacterium]